MRAILKFAAALMIVSAPFPRAETPAAPRAESPRFAATIPPVADILSQIAEGRAEVDPLLPAGASPHTHEPRPSDLRKVEKALALFYVDERLDGWATSLPVERRIRILSLLPDSLLREFPGEDGSPGAGGDGSSERTGPGAHDHGIGTDPHFWTDPLAVRAIVPRLAEMLIEADPGGAGVYLANALSLEARLDSLHLEIERRIAPVRGRSVLLSHPFLCYYLRRYGIPLAGVIEVVEGREPTAKDLARTIRLAPDRGASAILVLPQLSRRAADLVAESTGLPVRVVDPLGGAARRETYDELLLAITEGVVGEDR
ncbi:MAG: metal ABC transporter substrate-binding protein [Candidatus Eisenbacteria bacterium]